MRARSESGETTMGTGPCIVDLSDEDDDEDLVLLTEFPPHLLHRAPRKKQSETVTSLLNSDLVIIEEVDVNPELSFGAGLQKGSQKSAQDSNSLLDEDDCCILDEDPSKVGMVNSSCPGNETDDLVMTGEVGQVACRDFPHARHLCVQFPFKTSPHQLFCYQCHCYVCDVVAPCSLWGDGRKAGDHCHASEKIGERWKLLRQYNRTHPTGCSDPSTLQHLLCPGKSLAGNSESASLRELLGCQPDDSARSQHPQRGDPTRPKYPLQISLNGSIRDTRAHPRRHHTPGIGVRAAKFHRYVHRNDPHYTNSFRSYHPEGYGAYQSRRTSQKNGSLSSQPPHSCSNPGSGQRSQSVYSAVLPRRSTPTVVEQESFGGMVQDGDTGSRNDYLRELAVSHTFLASRSSDTPEDLRQLCLSTETPSASYFGGSVLPNHNEIGAYNSQGDGTAVSCNSILADAQISGGSFIEILTEGTIDSLPTSPPTLLADYLLNGDDLWNA